MVGTWKPRRPCGLSLLFLLALSALLPGCMRAGAVSILDGFGHSADAQALMNESLDRFLAEANLDDLAGKTVGITMAGTTTRVGHMVVEMQQAVVEDVMGPAWSSYLRSGLERKLSLKNARCATSNPDVQLVVTKNNGGVQFSAFYVPFFPFFVVDLYQHRTYWAVFDATLDVKSADGSRVLRTQRVNTRSHDVTRPTVFAMSLLF